jgi:nitroreductase
MKGGEMLTVKEAIEKRRSIRKFRPDPIPIELVEQLLDAARLAPSASNRQPWRFQIITDTDLKRRIFEEATFGQKHVKEAPMIIVCGSELFTFVKRHPLAPPGSDYYGADSDNWDDIKAFIPDAQMNTAIAMEHMVLMATALGVGTCWVQGIRFGQLAKILGWPRHVVVHAILAMGYQDETPQPRPRLSREEIQSIK